jgi:hypothetical protein
MKKLYYYSIIIFSLFSFSSCIIHSSRKSYSTETQQVIAPEIHTNNVIADLEVKEQKVTGTANGLSIKGNTVESTKEEAVFLALKSANDADILVQPKYEITVSSDGAIVVVVTGYPAKYKNFRPLQKSDFTREILPDSSIVLTYPTNTAIPTEYAKSNVSKKSNSTETKMFSNIIPENKSNLGLRIAGSILLIVVLLSSLALL